MIRGTAVAADSSPSVQSSPRNSVSEQSENPLDVLSRAATMVEKSAEIIGGKVSPPPSHLIKKHHPGGQVVHLDRNSSFKERLHPKFRKSSTPDYLVALDVARSLKRQTSIQSDQSENNMDTSLPNNNSLQPHEDLPLDMSIKKRPTTPPQPQASLPPPPPYRFKPQTSPPTHFMYKSPPPPYPATPSPPMVPLPPPPTYEDSTVRCTYPSKNTPPPPTNHIHQAPPNLHQEEEKTKIKEITIITNSASDPLLDEHFRRSLGADYESLFKKKSGDSESSSASSSSTESTPPKVPDQVVVNSGGFKPSPILKTCSEAKQNIVSSDSIKIETTSPASSNDSIPRESDSTKVDDPVKAFQEDQEMEGYTVEDHFAKALGDTWIKLQKAEEEKRSAKNKSEDKPTLVVSS